MTKSRGFHRTDKQYLEAIAASYGNMTAITEILGLKAVSMVRERINNNPVLYEALLESRELKMDLIENAFIKKIKEGDRFVIIQGIKSGIMRKRGYGNKIEIESTNTNTNTNVDLSKLTVDELILYENLVNKTVKES